jgi:hypothetical protein
VCLYTIPSVLKPRPLAIIHALLNVPFFTPSCSNLFIFTQCSAWTCQFLTMLMCYCWCTYFKQWEIYMYKIKMHVGTVNYFLALISAVFLNISFINKILLSKRLTE